MKVERQNIDFLVNKVARDDDQGAFEQLFNIFGHRLYNFSHVLVGSKQVAEEVVSDVFVKLWNNRKRLTEINNLETYLFIAVKNQSFNCLSRERKHAFVSIDDVVLNQRSNSVDPQKEIELYELKKDIEFAVDNLPTNCQIVFRLIREDGFKYKEVAEILDISVKTVENHFSRALKKLEVALANHLPGKKGKLSRGLLSALLVSFFA